MYYWTPKRIKELKDAGYRLHFDQSSLVKKSDQAISKEPATAGNQRSPGPGLKLQAATHDLAEATGLKQRDSQVVNQVKLSSQSQAPSTKHQASSSKLIKQQAASFKPRG